MGIERLGGSHGLHGTPDPADSLFADVLECDLTAIAVEVYSAIGCCIAVCWQCVVGAAGIVAGTLASIPSEEHASRIDYTCGKGLEIVGLDDEMLRSIDV